MRDSVKDENKNINIPKVEVAKYGAYCPVVLWGSKPPRKPAC
jgi:hypothetical protein